MVNFASDFLDENFRTAEDAVASDPAVKAVREQMRNAPDESSRRVLRQKIAARYAQVPRPPLKSLIDNIDHIVKVAGVDHVGLGSDFDGISSTPMGIDSAADLPKITQALLDRGYSAEQIRKILGGNLLRVFREVERVSRQLQKESAPNSAD
jgi:membrane dipeptidase